MAQEIQLQGLPFKLNTAQVFYVEKKEDRKLNSFILENYDWLREIFRKHRLQFIYLPIVGEEIVRYDAPFLDEERRNSAVAALDLASYINDEEFPASLVFSLSETHSKTNTLSYLPIERRWFRSTKSVFEHLALEIRSEKDTQWLNDIREESLCRETSRAENYCAGSGVKHSIGEEEPSIAPNEKPIGGSEKRYSLEVDPPLFEKYSTESASMREPRIRFSRRNYIEPSPREADETFNEESKKIIEEIQQRIDALREMGVDTLFLHGLIDKGEKLSRLHITKDKRILLPDYNNMEIHMSELPKAVFLLFLYHPEGIRFKELPDYRDELRAIYHSLSPRGSKEKQEKSICDVTDPMNNSINEKCARIREAFVSQFDDRLARNYYITGKQGEAKCITLDDDLITIDR